MPYLVFKVGLLGLVQVAGGKKRTLNELPELTMNDDTVCGKVIGLDNGKTHTKNLLQAARPLSFLSVCRL